MKRCRVLEFEQCPENEINKPKEVSGYYRKLLSNKREVLLPGSDMWL